MNNLWLKATLTIQCLLLAAITVALFNALGTSSIRQLEDRQANHLSYLEGRHNDLAAKLDTQANEFSRKLQILEARIRR
jgi:hypothetical protein